MTSLLRSLLVLAVAGVLVTACGKKEEAAPAPAPAAAAPAAAPAPAAPVAGGYEPSAEERVPGITVDAATLAAEAAAAGVGPAPVPGEAEAK